MTKPGNPASGDPTLDLTATRSVKFKIVPEEGGMPFEREGTFHERAENLTLSWAVLTVSLSN